MPQVTCRDWVFDADVDATRAAYARAKTGGAEECECDTCRSYIAVRSTVYPQEVRDLFTQLGIDAAKEGEAYWVHRSDDGLHHYGGWFHFIGSTLSGPTRCTPVGGPEGERVSVEFSPTFSLQVAATADAPRLLPLRSARAVQLEFWAAVVWQCDRPEPV